MVLEKITLSLSRVQRKRATCHRVFARLDAKEVSDLLDVLCRQHGFCLPPSEYDKLVIAPPDDSDTFAEAVVLAEGLSFAKSDPVCRGVRETVGRVFLEHNRKRVK